MRKVSDTEIPSQTNPSENITICDSCHVPMSKNRLKPARVIAQVSKAPSVNLCETCYLIEMQVRYGPFE